jgi:hypothetical protein
MGKKNYIEKRLEVAYQGNLRAVYWYVGRDLLRVEG